VAGWILSAIQLTMIFNVMKEMNMAQTPRRPVNPMDAAEALFKPAKKVAAAAVERPAVPNTKEMVSIRIDSDVLAHFQDDGPGWQDRINDVLRAAMKATLSV
jgi:uncharacterized protein (DUF4415 family)